MAIRYLLIQAQLLISWAETSCHQLVFERTTELFWNPNGFKRKTVYRYLIDHTNNFLSLWFF
ncbi:hypothetical protein EDE11_13122 [Methylomonas methanica]|uniref:Uncharacterized protein n=1 Tax=Methylomonas methanica TaxID=421 RepID=A0ABY2CGM0_METMH|nr:hypothetical protein EDE11_13122 [Methylomonas methanica]